MMKDPINCKSIYLLPTTEEEFRKHIQAAKNAALKEAAQQIQNEIDLCLHQFRRGVNRTPNELLTNRLKISKENILSLIEGDK